MRSLELEIEGMHCGACAETIEALLAREPGVKAASVSYPERKGRVLYEPGATDPDRLRAVIEKVARGFVSLALFGLALSLPLVVAVLFAPARRGLDWLASLTGRVPLWTGVLLIALGLWSVWFGLFVRLE
jgi:copper chaperone CopZ